MQLHNNKDGPADKQSGHSYAGQGVFARVRKRIKNCEFVSKSIDYYLINNNLILPSLYSKIQDIIKKILYFFSCSVRKEIQDSEKRNSGERHVTVFDPAHFPAEHIDKRADDRRQDE